MGLFKKIIGIVIINFHIRNEYLAIETFFFIEFIKNTADNSRDYSSVLPLLLLYITAKNLRVYIEILLLPDPLIV